MLPSLPLEHMVYSGEKVLNNGSSNRAFEAIYCCAQSLKFHVFQSLSHLSHPARAPHQNFLKIHACLGVPFWGSFFATMAIKRSSSIAMFLLRHAWIFKKFSVEL